MRTSVRQRRVSLLCTALFLAVVASVRTALSFSSVHQGTMPPCKASVFIATSEDGFIAKEDGSVDWLNEQNEKVPPGVDTGFEGFMASVGAIIMGRKTFDSVCGLVEQYGWAYGDTPVVVLSSSPSSVKIPDSLSERKISVMQGTPKEVLEKVAADFGCQDAYVDGGSTIRGFLAAGVVQRVIITTVPVTLGAGIPLFDDPEQKARLKQEGEPTKWDFGFTQTTYSVVPASA
eukprot:TRINITY_DN18175_c0_g1_i1.p1 TRINITY_DN18175_c0_g1~~TRINITY_DN18175_c0_g1_i1.p1  ORF type:complete len:232 (-),score=45.65 TRINITY_DN18175_c0_g1_i1:255-950(-)